MLVVFVLPGCGGAKYSARVKAGSKVDLSTVCKEGNNKFTGTIQKVTIDLKEMKAANAVVEQHVVSEAHVRKALAD